ncbi:MAG: DegV family protein [Limnochordales bacterium]|nr:DegV family protein [Limnochordales bacterium]
MNNTDKSANRRPGFAVVTDSGADIPAPLRDELGIKVVPLSVRLGEREFLDGVDLSTEEFWALVRRSDVIPQTSQPGPADFERVYRELVNNGYSVLSIHLSGELSGTIQSARLAAQHFSPGAIRVVDSRSASLGIGFLAMRAARLAQLGLTCDEAEKLIQELITEVRAFFTVESLEWLRRNGRIGRAKAFLGTLLNVKPVLALEDGVVSPVEQVRSRERSLRRIVELARTAAAGRPVEIGIVHGDTPAEAEALLQEARAAMNVSSALVTPLGPTIGSHTGPGTIGLLLIPA